MDKLTAYRILGLANNASIEEVKEAYARLSKEYHPEENPEEFQQIHEAYTTLTRRGRRASQATLVEPSVVKQTTSVKKEETDLVFRGIEAAREAAEDDVSYDFDKGIQQAQANENQKLFQIMIQADRELKILFASGNYKSPDKFKSFFAREEYTDALYTRELISGLVQCLSKEKLKPELYSFLIEFYRLREIEWENLSQEAQKLYQVIDSRYAIKKDTYIAQRSINKYAMLAIISFVLIRNGSRLTKVLEGNDFPIGDIVGNVILYLLIAGVGVWIYKLIRRQHSTYFAQAVVAGIFTVISIALIGVFSFWVEYTGIETSVFLSLSAVFLWVNVDWLIIVGITAFLQNLRRRK